MKITKLDIAIEAVLQRSNDARTQRRSEPD
jgi:hypothetical protein